VQVASKAHLRFVERQRWKKYVELFLDFQMTKQKMELQNFNEMKADVVFNT